MDSAAETDVLDLLPQRPPFVVIDRLLHCDATAAVACLTVRPEGLFVEGDRLSAAGIVESMAQTCAARMGYVSRQQGEAEGNGGGVRLGFIGSIRNLVIDSRPRVNDRIRIEMEVVSEVFAITLVKVRMMHGPERVAGCEMKIFLTNEESK
jgi:predicted hotdog family 3-hydroxylacyl-ACP dehydratase